MVGLKGAPRWQKLTAGLLALLALDVLGHYVYASFDAGWVIDDEWGIRVHGAGPLLQVLWEEFTGPTYARADAGSVDQYAWGPLAAMLQDLVAAGFGRGSVTPFRLLNVAVFVPTVLAVGLLVRTLTRSTPWGLAGAVLLCLHPVAAECVPWSSDLYDVLGGAVLALGLAAFAATSPDRAFRHAAITLVATVLACLAKPTAMPLALAFPALAWVVGRTRQTLALSLAAALVGAFLHRTAYQLATSSTVLQDVLRALVFGVNDTRSSLAVSYGLSLLDGVRALTPPAVMRLVAVELDGPRAVRGYAALSAAVIALGVLRRERFARPAAVALALWLIGLLPGALFSVYRANHGIRYSYLPLVASLPFALLALQELGRSALVASLVARLSPQGLGLLRVAAWLTIVGTAAGWRYWACARIADYRDNATFFTAERSDQAFAEHPTAGPILEALRAQSTFQASLPAWRAGGRGNPCAVATQYADAALQMPPNYVLDGNKELVAVLTLVHNGRDVLTVGACGPAELAELRERVAAVRGRLSDGRM